MRFLLVLGKGAVFVGNGKGAVFVGRVKRCGFCWPGEKVRFSAVSLKNVCGL